MEQIDRKSEAEMLEAIAQELSEVFLMQILEQHSERSKTPLKKDEEISRKGTSHPF